MISFLFHNLEFLYGYQHGAGKQLLENSRISRASWSRYVRDRNLPVHRLTSVMNAMHVGPEVFFGAIGFRATVADIAPKKDYRPLRLDHQLLDTKMRTSRFSGGPNMREAALAIGVSEVWLPQLTREDTPIDAEQLCRMMNLYDLTLEQVFVPVDGKTEPEEQPDDMLSEKNESLEFQLNAAKRHIANLEDRVQKLEAITTRLINLHKRKKL